MFDIGFSEMLVIAVVALIVIGPERLPKVARTLGHLFGRMQRYVNDVKADISREMELEELRKLQTTVEEAARALETGVGQELGSAQAELNKVAADTSAALAGPGAETAASAAVPAGGANGLPATADAPPPAPRA